MNDVEKFIATIRNSFTGSTVVYTRGACFEFFKILKQVFPQAFPFYDHREGHVYTLIDGVFYDINGKKFFSKGTEPVPMDQDRHLIANAHRWMPHSNFRVVRLLED